MIQLYKKQKVTFLTEELLNCLETYDIELEQIYSSTLDYGGNVIKFGQILQEQQQDEKINENDAHKYYDNIDEIADKIQRDLTPVLTEFVCAAHTIQLAAYDVIKTLQKPISDCRKAFKTVWNLMRASGAYEELPELDNAIGWNSIFEMLKSLQKLKDFIDSQFLEELNSQNAIWQFVYEFLESFTPLDNCSKLLQKEQYVLGDFYRDWLNCEIELEDITTATASKLREAMRKREKLLLENSAFLAALYLDPRFNFMNSTILSKQQKSQALEHLVKTFDMTQEMENVKEEEFIKTVDEPEEHYEKPTTSSGAYAKLAQRIMTSVVNTSKSAENNLTFREKLMNLSNTNMVSLDTNILEYFKATPLDSDVVKVINIALAVPAGQISVETAASALSLGNKLNNITLNNLLITKLNFAEIKPSSVNIDFHNEQDLKLSFY